MSSKTIFIFFFFFITFQVLEIIKKTKTKSGKRLQIKNILQMNYTKTTIIDRYGQWTEE